MTSLSPTRFVVVALALLSGCFALPPLFPQPDGGKVDGGVQPRVDGGTTTTDGGLSVADACPVLNARRCEYFARCGLIEDTAQAKQECARGLEVNWCGPLTWPAHVAKSALKYDPLRAEACADSFLTRSCDEWSTLSDSCNRFLAPRVPLGGDCYDGYAECTDGVCRGSSCPRTCQPRALLDEVCSFDADCRTGLYCKLSRFMPTVGQCAAYGAIGAACEISAQCAEGLQCIEMQCRALPQPGMACLGGACSEAGYCEDVGDGGVCVGRRAEGAPCVEGQCQVGLVCDPLRSSCVKKQLQSGEDCSLAQTCPAGLTCLGATDAGAGLCLPPVGEGDACVADRDCEIHLACRDVGDVGDGGLSCQRRASAGTPCTSAQTCQSGAVCSNGQCVLLPLPGESCAATRACRWGLCRELVNSDGGAVCGSLLSAGQSCARNDECASGSCVMNTCVARCVP